MLRFRSGCGPGTECYDSKNLCVSIWHSLSNLTDVVMHEHRHAYNYRSQYTHTCLPLQTECTLQKFTHLQTFTNPTAGSEFDWVYLVDTGPKSSDGKTACEVLLDIIKAFPKYDLKSDEGIDKGIGEIATKLGKLRRG